MIISADPQRIEFEQDRRTSTLVIGAGVLNDPCAHLPFTITGRKVFVLTDRNVFAPVAEPFIARLVGASAVHTLVLDPGEATKSFAQYQQALDFLLRNGADRQSVICAVGGGVVGDLAGFVAATVLRGVMLVQVPTTLLAQVDSSVGGKNGINTEQGKNLVGTFYQPHSVLIDPHVLKTLPVREFRAGYAEVYKYGLILDADFAVWLEKNQQKILMQDAGALTHAVTRSCHLKVDVVKQDAREEKDIRALLNLGHTFGHALEVLNGYNANLLHGEAVAIGMVLAMRLSEVLGLVGAGDVARVTAHLQAAQLPTAITDIPGFSATPDAMLARMRGDKKASAGKMAFVVCKKIGHAVVRRDVPEDVVRSLLEHQ